MTPRRLLVCDDEPDFRFFLRKFAEMSGLAVREVERSADCVRAVKEFKPDIVVLDIVMPPPDGIEIVRALAQAGYRGRIIMTSGYNPHYMQAASVFGRQEGLEIRSLPKPVSALDLEAAIA